MLITCSRDELLGALQAVQKGAATQTTLQILSGILLKTEKDNLILQATNLEISIMTAVPATVKKTGMTVVPAKLMVDIVRNLPPGPVEIGLDPKEEQTLYLLTNQAEFKIRTLPPEDFPSFPQINEEAAITVKSTDLQEILRQTLKAVSRDETRPILNGALFVGEENNLKVVATDSYRLAVRDFLLKEKIKEKIEIVVPWRALDELQKIIPTGGKEVKIFIGESQIVFKLNETIFVSRLIEGQFPNYQQLLPKEYGLRLEIDREDIAGAVTRAALLAQKNQSIKLKIDDKKMWVSSQAQGVGEAQEELVIKPDGKGDFEIAFNAQYLLDGINSVKEDRLVFELNNPVSPGLIRSTGENNYLYLIMPIRIGA